MWVVSFRHDDWRGKQLRLQVKGREALHWGCPHGESIAWMLWSGLG